MSEQTDLIDEAVKQSGSGGVLSKAYDDLAHQSLKSIGNTLSLLPRTVGVWLGGWEKWVVNGEESIRLTREAIKEKVKNIPEEKLTEPEPYVAVPAIQQLSYCYDSKHLRELYANLLVSSMNIDTKNQVHPAFVEIIKQLTPDEAKLLKRISEGGNDFPFIDLRLVVAENGEYIIKIYHFSNLSEGVCDYPEGIAVYLDNFIRLGIMEIPSMVWLSENELYAPLENHPKIKEKMNEPLPKGQHYEIVRGLVRITAFGRNFIKICVPNETGNAKDE